MAKDFRGRELTADDFLELEAKTERQAAWIAEAFEVLSLIQPYTDAIICYASTISEYPPNSVPGRIDALLECTVKTCEERKCPEHGCLLHSEHLASQERELQAAVAEAARLDAKVKRLEKAVEKIQKRVRERAKKIVMSTDAICDWALFDDPARGE